MSLDALDILDAIESPSDTLSRLRPKPHGWSLCSASQIALHGDDSGGEVGCPRRWWISAVAGEREPELPHQVEGTRLHAEVAEYLTRGTQPGPVASTVIEYLPPVPMSPTCVERPFAVVGLPVPVVGAVDVAWTKSDRIAVRDLKFVSTIRRDHRQQDLSRDPQAILYSAALQPTCLPLHVFPIRLGETSHPIYRLAPANTGVEFCKIYASRSSPKAELVGAYFAPEVIDAGVARIAAQMLTMVERAENERVDAVPSNPNACRSYGVMCPHRGLCDLLGDSVLNNPFAKKTADVAAVNAAAQAELMAPPPPEPAPALPAPSTRTAALPAPPLHEIERTAKWQKSQGMNRNAARPAVCRVDQYPGYSAPLPESVEVGLRNVFGAYAVLGDAAFALSEHRRLRTPQTEWTPEAWHGFFGRASAPGVPLPTVWDIACYVFDGSARAEERGYKYQEGLAPVPVETLPVMASEDKAAEMSAEVAPPAPPPPAPPPPAAKPPKRAREAIPDHPLIPADLRGALRQQITLQLAGPTLTSLVVAAREAGHDIMTKGHSTRREMLAEIADVVTLITGERPWGAESDDSAEAPPAPPVPTADTAAAVVTPALPAPAPPVPPSPPEPPASSDVAGGAIPRPPHISTLYIDCMPVGDDFNDFAGWVSIFEIQAAEELEVSDYRLALFHEGDRRIASNIHRALAKGETSMPTAMFLSSRHPLAGQVESVLTRFATRVVRAVR